MPTTINPLITNGGLSAAIAANGLGLQIAITHLALGTGQYTPAGTATALVNRKEKVTISGGFVSGVGGFRVNALFPAWGGVPNPYNATEIGFYAGDPDAGGTLFAVYSHVSDVLVVRNTLQYIASFGLQLNRVPVGSVTITLDPSGAQALALIANHEAASNPHSQYATTASLSLHTGGADPHTQYALKSGAAFTGGVSAPGFTGPLAGNATTAANAQNNGFATAGAGAAGSENQLTANCNGYNSAYLYNNSSGWGLFSTSGGQVVNYSRASGKATFTGEATALNNNTDYTIKQRLYFSNNGTEPGYIRANDPAWGMVYQPSINGSNSNSHLWTNVTGTGIMFLTPSGNLSTVADVTTKKVYATQGSATPNNPQTFAYTASGGYGGGYGFIDGSYGMSIYSIGGVMHFALGSTTATASMANLSSANGGTFTCGYLAGALAGTIDPATTAATQSSGDNSTKVATTAFVQANKAIKAWVNFNGSSGAVNASAGVSSVTRISAGQYRVNLSTTQPDTNYAVVSCTNAFKFVASHELARTTSYYAITTFDANNGGTADVSQVYSMLAGN